MDRTERQPTGNPYIDLPWIGPMDPGVSGALITTVNVLPGFERSYNRWYDHDHFYAGMMSLPWCFSGARWIATRDLRGLRYPADGAFVDPITDGNFLHTYLASAGRMEAFSEAVSEAAARLLEDGRMNRDGGRRQVFTAQNDYVGAVYRDAEGPRDIHAFDHPYPACILQIIDAPTPERRTALERWLLADHLPASLAGSPAAMCLAFRTRPVSTRLAYIAQEMRTDRFTQRVVVLWLLETDPVSAWEMFAKQGEAIERAGLGRMEFISGYLRLVPGTNTHIDQLF